jgi:hypothetical protein
LLSHLIKDLIDLEGFRVTVGPLNFNLEDFEDYDDADAGVEADPRAGQGGLIYLPQSPSDIVLHNK